MTDARRRANRKYSEKTYDRVAIRVKKGIRDEWQAAAAARGLSFAGLITQAVENYLQTVPAPELDAENQTDNAGD